MDKAHKKRGENIMRSHLKVFQITQKHFYELFKCFDDLQMPPQN